MRLREIYNQRLTNEPSWRVHVHLDTGTLTLQHCDRVMTRSAHSAVRMVCGGLVLLLLALVLLLVDPSWLLVLLTTPLVVLVAALSLTDPPAQRWTSVPTSAKDGVGPSDALIAAVTIGSAPSTDGWCYITPAGRRELEDVLRRDVGEYSNTIQLRDLLQARLRTQNRQAREEQTAQLLEERARGDDRRGH